MKDDWDLVSSPAEEPKVTDDWDAVSTMQPPRPPVKRKSVSGSSFAITVLSVAVIGLLVFTGLNIFHVVNLNFAASGHMPPVNVGINSSATATPNVEVTAIAQENATATAQAATTPTVATSSSSPTITSVSQFRATQDQTITISGSGFGTHAPFTNATTLYLAINDVTDSDWEAGYGYDWVTVNVWVWNDSEIVITGLAGYYGQDGFVYRVGDTVTISVWNAQSSGGGNCPSGGCAGSATFNLTVTS
jgi:hypothetical protein